MRKKRKMASPFVCGVTRQKAKKAPTRINYALKLKHR